MNPPIDAEPAPAVSLCALAALPAPRTRVRRSDLRAIVAEGGAFSLMVGVGESYLPAFALALGLGQVAAGLITTVPLMAGAVLQLAAPWGVQRLRSHRRWTVLCATLQAASFVPLAVAAVLGHMPTLVVFAVVAVYWGSGLAINPAWSTWVEALVPGRLRARYFARRTRVGQIATLLGFVLGGTSLQLGALVDCQLLVFAALFGCAAVCRLASAAFLAAQSEPLPLPNVAGAIRWRGLLPDTRRLGTGRLLFYFMSVQAAAQIAGPYFTSYMLGPMRLSYATYVGLIGISFTAKALALPACGAFAARFGTRKLLWLGGLGIVPISGLWVYGNALPYLAVVQVISGVTWAAYELAMLLLFFETLRPEERTGVMTVFNLANALATAAGSLLGGGLLAWFGKTQQVYVLLFALSSMARAVTLFGLIAAQRAEKHDATIQTRRAEEPALLPFDRSTTRQWATSADRAA